MYERSRGATRKYEARSDAETKKRLYVEDEEKMRRARGKKIREQRAKEEKE